MAKTNITYTDEAGVERPLENESYNKNNQKHRGPGAWYFILVLILAFIMGAAGSLGVLIYLSGNDALKAKIGLKNLTLPITKTEKINIEESSAIIDTVKKVSPAVVSISLTSNVQDLFGQTYQTTGAGTGFIITSDGLIATNKHVASDTNTEYTVFTADGKNYKAKIVAQDPTNDLAILKIDATGLPTVELGDSNNAQIGQWVVAIGNALGEFSNSITVGVISAKDRQITASGGSKSETLEGLLQTDAAINPGNSGGPLVNLAGQVIGMNTAVANAQSIGFAIPVNVVKKDIDSYNKNGKIIKPMLGVRYVPITKEIAKVNNLKVENGAWILRGANNTDVAIIPGSPADKAELKENDIITAIGGQKINDTHSLTGLIAQYNVGDKVEITYLRGGEEYTTTVILVEAD